MDQDCEMSIVATAIAGQDDNRESLGPALITLLGRVVEIVAPSLYKTPCRTSIRQGHTLVAELLDGHPGRFFENARMSKAVFIRLCDILSELGLQDTTKGVTVAHQLMIFLFIVKDGASSRTAQEHFQHSGETISRHFHKVLAALVHLAPSTMMIPNGTYVAPEIASNTKFFPYFRDAIGAVDGTHIPVYIKTGNADAFRDKDGRLSQNVLACCDFGMMFQFVLAGWEGSAHDGLLGDHALRTGLIIPRGKYLLADAGFPICEAFLVPYRGVRYHLRETAQAAQRLVTINEEYSVQYNVSC